MSDTTAALVCPKCRGAMRAYERNGVTIDQCEECRGIFLDRGELERLIDAEEQRYGAAPPPYQDDDRSYRRGHDDDHRERRGHDDDHDGWRGPKQGGKRRRGGFLGELFD